MARKGYSLQGKYAFTINPSDATTSYVYDGLIGTVSTVRIPVPIAGRAKRVSVNFANLGTLGSSEASSIRLNIDGATSQHLISNNVVNNSVVGIYELEINIPLTTSSFVNIQRTTPTRVTNPTSVALSYSLRIE